MLISDELPIPFANTTLTTPVSVSIGFIDDASSVSATAYAPLVVHRSMRRFRKPGYYAYFYRLNAVLLCLSLFGILTQGASWYITEALSPYQPQNSYIGAPDNVVSQAHLKLDPSFARHLVWLMSVFMMAFWSILATLRLVYVIGIALIYLDAARRKAAPIPTHE